MIVTIAIDKDGDSYVGETADKEISEAKAEAMRIIMAVPDIDHVMICELLEVVERK